MIELLQKHRRQGAELDTNILLALVIGSYDPNLLGEFKRVENFDPADADLLQRFVFWIGDVIVTPNVMTEVANLASQLGEPKRGALFRDWSTRIHEYSEHYIQSGEIASDAGFSRYFLTDLGLVALSRRGRLILTDDRKLEGLVCKQGGDVLNFNHLRLAGWKTD